MEGRKNPHGRHNKDPNQTSRDENYGVWDEKYKGLGKWQITHRRRTDHKESIQTKTIKEEREKTLKINELWDSFEQPNINNDVVPQKGDSGDRKHI